MSNIKEEWLCRWQKIKRWFIKVYLNLQVGNHLAYGGKLLSLHYKNIEPYLLENLFHGSPLPNSLGICFEPDLLPVPENSQIGQIFNGISVTPRIIKDTKIIYGMSFKMVGLSFYLLIRAESKSVINIHLHRPSILTLNESKIRFV